MTSHNFRLPQALAVVLLAAAAVTGATMAGATARVTHLTPIVNQLSTVPSGGGLSSVTCVTTSSCVAVGSDFNGLPLVVHGSPASWGSAQAKQIDLGASFGGSGSLQSVSCVSSTSCVAIGTDHNNKLIVLHGNPATWGPAQAREISLGSSFGAYVFVLSISCTSATSCVAAGSDAHGEPLVLHGNPATWGAAQASELALGATFGSGGSLTAVACVTATVCTAVGSDYHGQPLTLTGDPSTWSAADATELALGAGFANGGSLSSISCPVTTQCTAGGTDHNSQPLVLSGDPTKWTAAQASQVTLGAGFGSAGWLVSLSCGSPTQCTAVGNDAKSQPLVLSGDPATWTAAQAHLVTLNATFRGNGSSSAVDCASGSSCVAVGNGVNSVLFDLTGTPSGWTGASVHAIVLKGAGFGVVTTLNAVTCTSATACVVVGEDRGFNPFVIAGDPAKWGSARARELPLGASFGNGGSLISIACTSSTSCTAVGYDDKDQPLVLHGNPASWGPSSARALTLSAHFGKGGALDSVTCPTPTLCVAVGADNLGQLLLLRGNPANWGVAELRGLSLSAKLGASGQLHSIWCMTVTVCTTVGSDAHGDPIDLTGNAATWTAAKVHEVALTAAFGKGGSLTDVSCSAATMCVAVGSDYKSQALVIRGNPAGWSAGMAFHVKITTPPNTVEGFSGYGRSVNGRLADVSCSSATDCMAVGYDWGDSPLYLQGNPASWKTAAAVRPPASATFAEGSFDATFCGFGTCDVVGVASGKATGSRPAFLAHN